MRREFRSSSAKPCRCSPPSFPYKLGTRPRHSGPHRTLLLLLAASPQITPPCSSSPCSAELRCARSPSPVWSSLRLPIRNIAPTTGTCPCAHLSPPPTAAPPRWPYSSAVAPRRRTAPPHHLRPSRGRHQLHCGGAVPQRLIPYTSNHRSPAALDASLLPVAIFTARRSSMRHNQGRARPWAPLDTETFSTPPSSTPKP
uniref:Uncharacterized protein n=1 Tax=Arundo donax TaxID=35708 RepID=A0A0A9NAC7_ARUDO